MSLFLCDYTLSIYQPRLELPKEIQDKYSLPEWVTIEELLEAAEHFGYEEGRFDERFQED